MARISLGDYVLRSSSTHLRHFFTDVSVFRDLFSTFTCMKGMPQIIFLLPAMQFIICPGCLVWV